jgi:BCD family chlorophyll transporter-like MFS transporter
MRLPGRPGWARLGAGLAFLMVGAGLHMTQTVGLALATDLVPPTSRPKVVGLMYVMLLLGTIGSALIFGQLLEDFTPAKLIQVIQGAAVATMALNILALWKQEPRRRGMALPAASPQAEPSFAASLGDLQPAPAGHAPSGGPGPGLDGLQHAGRAAGALWRPDPRL